MRVFKVLSCQTLRYLLFSIAAGREHFLADQLTLLQSGEGGGIDYAHDINILDILAPLYNM